MWHHNEMTFAMVYAWSEHFTLPISHDEVVHGKGSLVQKMPGDRWQKTANLRAYLGYMWAHPGKQLLFMGSEFAQTSEWSEERGLEWWLCEYQDHYGVQHCVRDMNAAYRETRALWDQDNTPEGFQWIDANDASGNVFSWLRVGSDGSVLASITNFSPVVRGDYRVGLPSTGYWREVLNTDAEAYGGSGVGNFGGVVAEEQAWHGRPASAMVTPAPAGHRSVAALDDRRRQRHGRVGARSAIEAEPPRPASRVVVTSAENARRRATARGSEQGVRQVDAGTGDGRVLGADNLEEVEQVGAQPVAVVT